MSDAPKEFAGRVFLVTGATGGLGQRVSHSLAAAGATLALHGRVIRKLEALYDAIVAGGGLEPAILPLDFERATESDYAAAAVAIDAQLGRLDGIVHCAAALARVAPIEHHSPDDWARALRVNLSGPASLTTAMFPLLQRSPQAAVIFTLDSCGHEPRAYWGSHAAAKAGLEALVRVLADEWLNRPSLSAFGVIPGPVDSPLHRRAFPGADPAALRSLDHLVPLYIDLLAGRWTRDNGPIIDARQLPQGGSA